LRKFLLLKNQYFALLWAKEKPSLQAETGINTY